MPLNVARDGPDSRSLSVRALGDVFETRKYSRVCRVKRSYGCGCLSGQAIREVQVRVVDCCLCRKRCEEPLVPVYGFQECAQGRVVLGRNVLISEWTDGGDQLAGGNFEGRTRFRRVGTTPAALSCGYGVGRGRQRLPQFFTGIMLMFEPYRDHERASYASQATAACSA